MRLNYCCKVPTRYMIIGLGDEGLIKDLFAYKYGDNEVFRGIYDTRLI